MKAPVSVPAATTTASNRAGATASAPCASGRTTGSDLDDIDRISPANHISLRLARANFVRLGAADEAAKSFVASSHELASLRRELRAPD